LTYFSDGAKVKVWEKAEDYLLPRNSDKIIEILAIFSCTSCWKVKIQPIAQYEV
jgi:hypothetical protein